MTTMEEISKGLPSALKNAPMKLLKPGSYSQARVVAHNQGKHAAKVESIYQQRKAAPFNAGHTTLRYESALARNEGRATSRRAKAKLVPVKRSA